MDKAEWTQHFFFKKCFLFKMYMTVWKNICTHFVICLILQKYVILMKWKYCSKYFILKTCVLVKINNSFLYICGLFKQNLSWYLHLLLKFIFKRLSLFIPWLLILKCHFYFIMILNITAYQRTQLCLNGTADAVLTYNSCSLWLKNSDYLKFDQIY